MGCWDKTCVSLLRALGEHRALERVLQIFHLQENDMSIEGKAKEAAGFVKEELNEHGDSPEAKKKAQEGRDLRNEGRIEDGKSPKTTEPGIGAKE